MMLMDLASPVSAFVRDCCTRGPDVSVERDKLYNAWKNWCDDNGHEAGSQATFGRNLAAVVPDLGTAKPRVNTVQIRHYTHIALLGASPASPVIDAGRSAESEAGNVPHHVPQPDGVNQPPLPEAGSEAGKPHAKPLVKASEAGEAGNSAFSVQLKNGKTVTLRPGSAAHWFHSHIRDLVASGRTIARSTEVYAAGQAAGFGVNNLRQAAAAHPDLTDIGRDGRATLWDITPKQLRQKDAS